MDSILADRLLALEQSLERAKDPSGWKAQLKLQNLEVEDRVWNWAIMDIRREVSRISDALADIRSHTSAGESSLAEWQSYSEIYRASQELFRDSLELIGGLALRDKILDQDICRLTDELILNCTEAMITITNTSPTIPAHLELPPRMLRRVVRMRYPEWTIWTLPLAAYEFGHIAMGEVDELQKFCSVQAEKAVQARHANAAARSDSTADNDEVQRATRYVQILMADAFATYTLGPAYACPALLLQFSPIPDATGSEFGPPGPHRAKLVLDILEGMGKGDDQEDNNEFAAVLRQLRKRWDVVEQPVHNSTWIALDSADVLDIFSKELYRYRPTVRYPTGQGTENRYGGLGVAREWHRHWQDELDRNTGRLTVPPTVHAYSKLRDALNAAWICRLTIPTQDLTPERLTFVEMAAQSLCLAIIKARTSTKRSSGGQANLGPKLKG